MDLVYKALAKQDSSKDAAPPPNLFKASAINAGFDIHKHIGHNYETLSNCLRRVGIKNIIYLWEDLIAVSLAEPVRIGSTKLRKIGSLGHSKLDTVNMMIYSGNNFTIDNYKIMPCMCKDFMVAVLIIDTTPLIGNPDEIDLIEFLFKIIGQSWGTTITFKHAYEQTIDQVHNDYKMGIFTEKKMTEDLPYFTPLHIGLIDIDRFKTVNDTYGHEFGDVVLREFGRVLRAHSSRVVVPYRKGGDEVIIVSNDQDALMQYIAAVRNDIDKKEFIPVPNKTTKITLSIGVALNCKSATLGIKWADYYLYAVKNSGRNNCKVDNCRDMEPPAI